MLHIREKNIKLPPSQQKDKTLQQNILDGFQIKFLKLVCEGKRCSVYSSDSIHYQEKISNVIWSLAVIKKSFHILTKKNATQHLNVHLKKKLLT